MSQGLSKLVVISSTFLCTTSFANSTSQFYSSQDDFHPNAYIGAQVGYGVPDYGGNIKNAFNQYQDHTFDEDGIAGRVFIGYQFTPIIGLETGYNLFSDNTYKAYYQGAVAKYNIETDVWDILGVIRTPFFPFGQSGPVLSVKAGAAYVMSKGTFTANPYGVTTPFITAKRTDNNWEPEAGISLGYKLENNLALDVSYQHIFGSGNLRSPRIDFLSLGITYKFV